MDKVKTVTSLLRNRPKFFNTVKKKSFTYGFLGFLLGIFFGNIFSHVISYLGAILPIFGTIGGIIFGEWYLGGRYDQEKKENIYGCIINKVKRRKLRLSNEKIAKFDTKNEIKDETLYDMEGNEIIGFEIIRTDDPDFENSFKSAVENILKELPALDQVQFIRMNSDIKDEQIIYEREILRKKKIKDQRYFIFLSLFNGSHKKYKDKIKERLEFIGKKMTRKEISKYSQFVFAPLNPQIDVEKPIYPLTYFFGDKEVNAYNGDLVHGASSLASLPHLVSSDFNLFYKPLDKLNNIICATFRGQDGVSAKIKELVGILQQEKLTDKKSNAKKLESLEQQTIDAEEGRSVKLSMSINLVVFGDKHEVNKALTELEFKADEYPDSDYRPFFSRENAYLKEALFSILPGSRSFNKFRTQNIYSTLEAFCYVPFPAIKGEFSDKRSFNFRTTENTIWSFPYFDPKSTVIVGLPGNGKSLIAGRLFAHHIEMRRKGFKASGFILDLGDSFSFLEDGLADFVLKLNYDNSIGKYKPIDIHPLNLFKPFGDKVKYAKKFLCQLMGFDPEEPKSQTASDGNVVTSSLNEFYRENLNRLSEFRTILERNLSNYFETISNKELKRSNWDEYKARLDCFCKGGINGDIFDPEEPKYNENDIFDIHFFYACKNTQTKDDKTLIAAFASLVLEFGNLLEERFKSGGENEPSNFFYCIDELQWWRDYIPHSWLRERASQNRKFGASLWLLTQDACDLLIPKIVLEEDRMASEYSLLEAMQRCFFFTLPQNLKVLSILAREPLTDLGSAIPNGRIKKMLEIEKSIQIASKYAAKNKVIDRIVGYCDHLNNMISLYAEYESSFLWASTTHNGGRAIRKKAMKYSGLKIFEVCEKLAKWEEAIPENQVHEKLEQDIFRTIFKVDHANF